MDDNLRRGLSNRMPPSVPFVYITLCLVSAYLETESNDATLPIISSQVSIQHLITSLTRALTCDIASRSSNHELIMVE